MTAEYFYSVAQLDTPFYQHNRGQVPVYNKQAWILMMERIKKTQKPWRKGQRLED